MLKLSMLCRIVLVLVVQMQHWYFQNIMLKNKRGLVFGIANNHSIAWGIAKQLAENGAEIAIGYQNEMLLKRVKPLSEEINSKILIECDFNNNDSIKKSVEIIKKEWGTIDFIIHAVAFADKSELNLSLIHI